MNLIQIIIDNFGEQFLITGGIISFIIGGIIGVVVPKYLFDSKEEVKDKNIID